MTVVDDLCKSVAIYGLTDPRTGELRYVGKTNQPLGTRLSQHISHRVRQRTKCSSWIRSLGNKGLTPEMFLIEEVAETNWREAEEFWISNFRFLGANLCNLQEGGKGPVGLRHSAERKQKISQALRGRKLSPESRAKLSASKLAAQTKRPDLAKRNESRAKLTQEQVAKIRDRSFKGVELAKEFGISPATVCDIRKGKIYGRFESSLTERGT